MNDTKEDFSSLFEMIPNASTKDIETLIEDINIVQDRKSKEMKNIEDWIPTKTTVLEILRLNVKVQDLSFCISNFKEFAEEKGWGINDNLGAKLIAHIKILEQSGRIKFNIRE